MKIARSTLGLAVAATLLAGCGGSAPKPATSTSATPSTELGARVADTELASGGARAPATAAATPAPASTSTAGTDATSAVPSSGPSASSEANPAGTGSPAGPSGGASGTAPKPKIPNEGAAFVPASPVPGGPDYDPAKATATVKVTVSVVNPPKMRPLPISGDAQCVALHKETPTEETVVAKDGKLANVIVYVSKGADKWTFKAPESPVTIDQKGCMYLPHVLSLMVGQPVVIKNSDAFLHNVHALPKLADDEFNSSQPAGAKDLTRKFTKAELGMKIKCEVHGWMGAFVGVFDHPFHGVTAADGTLSLKLPPGDYEISVWHEYPKFGKVAPQPVTVKDGEAKDLAFTFEKPK